MDIREIMDNYGDKPGGLIEAYHAIQKELNYLPREAITEAARVFGVSEAQAYGVATFYSYLSVEKGENTSFACAKALPVMWQEPMNCSKPWKTL